MMSIVIIWFRRDLRLNDNVALFHAMADGREVLPVFIFDTEILQKLQSRSDARVEFISQALNALNERLKRRGSSLLIKHGSPEKVWQELIQSYQIGTVYANHDYEPYALKRDEKVGKLLASHDIPFHTFKDQVIFEKEEITKENGTPYTVFTPYSHKWKSRLAEASVKMLPEHNKGNWCQQNACIPSLEEIGFRQGGVKFPASAVQEDILTRYAEQRDFPALHGTSQLGIHLRFGTISIRQLLLKAAQFSPSFVNELIWRDFYQMILWHYPHVISSAFKPAYDRILWINNEADFERWKAGETGYPLVDAGMRQLAATGWMHNRVRMVVASFLTKHLLIDWRWGETWFAEKLLDFELASNNGGWQWAAGCGCDAAPYFRVFNPQLQQEKFDPKHEYILKWIPEYGLPGYPKPMVNHEMARARAISVYRNTLNRPV
ncbi:MAG TPA: deoxyribodipyrimidine photolyase [Bacteroidales bacterium]|nr:deoxyribodipyrimidine photolyase [Bacteroidales bacterium]HBZ65790.1 deoxyribodipyrimidine photolyase [Bacteroidales bacterium]